MRPDIVPPNLRGATVVCIGGSAGIGLGTARSAQALLNTALTGATYDIDGGQQLV